MLWMTAPDGDMAHFMKKHDSPVARLTFQRWINFYFEAAI
jgi:hypothetical protein